MSQYPDDLGDCGVLDIDFSPLLELVKLSSDETIELHIPMSAPRFTLLSLLYPDADHLFGPELFAFYKILTDAIINAFKIENPTV